MRMTMTELAGIMATLVIAAAAFAALAYILH